MKGLCRSRTGYYVKHSFHIHSCRQQATMYVWMVHLQRHVYSLPIHVFSWDYVDFGHLAKIVKISTRKIAKRDKVANLNRTLCMMWFERIRHYRAWRIHAPCTVEQLLSSYLNFVCQIITSREYSTKSCGKFNYYPWEEMSKNALYSDKCQCRYS